MSQVKVRRDPVEVLTRVVDVLDRAQVQCVGLRKIIERAPYTAPEHRDQALWMLGTLWLQGNMPPPHGEFAPAWAREVSDIWEGRK